MADVSASGVAKPGKRVRPVRRARLGGPNWLGVGLLIPAAVIVGVFLVIPILYSVVLAFLRVDLSKVQPWSFYGLGNFAQIGLDSFVPDVAIRTLYFGLMVVGFTTTIGLAFALLLNEHFPGRRIAGLLVFLPWAIAPVAAGATWKLVWHVTTGLVNGVAVGLGLIPRNVGWLNDTTIAIHAAILGQVWLAIPFASLIFLARLQSVPIALYRAAVMDGAGLWARFRWVTLPQVKGTILLVVILETIISLQTFDLIYAMTSGGPAQSTVVFSMLIWTRTFVELRVGYGAALSLLLFVVIVTANLFVVILFRSGRPGWTRVGR